MNVNFTNDVQAYLEVARKDDTLISDKGVSKRTVEAANKVFDDVVSMIADKNPRDIASITTKAKQIFSDGHVHEKVKFYLLYIIRLATEEEDQDVNLNVSNEYLVEKIVQNVATILQPTQAPALPPTSRQPLRIQQGPSHSQLPPPPSPSTAPPLPTSWSLHIGRLPAPPTTTQAQTPLRQPGRLGDRTAFLTGQPKPVSKSFNPSELSGVKVSERRQNIEDLLKGAKEQVIDRGNKYLEELKSKVTGEPMYLQAIAGIHSDQQKALFVSEMAVIHDTVSRQVKYDFDAHLKDIKKVAETDPEILDKVNRDLSALLDGVPQGMSIERFLALSYVYHSYERALILDMEKWRKRGDLHLVDYKQSDEHKRLVQKQIALNYYQFFYDNLAEMRTIKGFEDIGKKMRQMEVDDAEIVYTDIAKSTLTHLEPAKYYPELARKVQTFKDEFKVYIEQGGNEIQCPPFSRIFHSRLPPPSKPPSWLSNTPQEQSSSTSSVQKPVVQQSSSTKQNTSSTSTQDAQHPGFSNLNWFD